MMHNLVLVVDDEQPIREMVRLTLEAGGYAPLTASSGADALTLLSEHGKDIRCMITDCQMANMSGPQLAHCALEQRPDLRVILMSGTESGAPGYPFLAKPFTPDQLLACVDDIIDAPDRPDPPPHATGTRRTGPTVARCPVIDPLTPREAEVLALIAQGYSVRRTADTLGIAHSTVECHRSRIYGKLDVHGTAGLVRYAIRHGIVEA